MFRKMIRTGPYRILTLAACCAALVFTAVGCKDSQDNAADRKSRTSVDQASRVLRGSNQGMVMTESEREKAAAASSPAQREKLAEQIKKRYDQQGNIQEFDEKINELTQLQQQYQQTNDLELLKNISDKFLQANQWLTAADVTMNAEAAAQNQQRMQNARILLQDALTQAGQAGNNTAQISPNLTQGALELIKYQAALKKYKTQEVRIRTLQTILGQTHTEVTRQEIFEMHLESRKPNETIGRLKTLLEGPGHGLRDQLAVVEQNIHDIRSRKQSALQQYESNLAKANALEKSSLALKMNAEKHDGAEKYKLLDEAYALRAGKGQGANRIEGSIYYGAQAELDKNQLETIQCNLEYELLRKDLISRSIQEIADSLTQLQDPDTAEKLQRDILEARQKRGAIIEQIQQQIAQMQEAEEEYTKLRKAPVATLTEAQNAFTRASRAARKTRQEPGGTRLPGTADFAEKLADGTARELTSFWQQTAQHYQTSTGMVGLLGNTAELRASVNAILSQYERNIEEAMKNIDILTAETEANPR